MFESSSLKDLLSQAFARGRVARHFVESVLCVVDGVAMWCKACHGVAVLHSCSSGFVSSLRRGNANILCAVPMLTDDPRRESAAYLSSCVCIVCYCSMFVRVDLFRLLFYVI